MLELKDTQSLSNASIRHLLLFIANPKGIAMPTHNQNRAKPLSLTTRLLHWIVAFFMIGLIAVGIYMDEAKVYSLYPIHKSLGIIAFVFIMTRVVWRVMKGWPTPVSQYHKHEQILSKIIHWILIIGTVLMPLSGMMMSGAGGHGLSVFGLELLAANHAPNNPDQTIPLNPTLAGLGSKVHGIVGNVLIAAIVLHVVGAWKHHLVDKDNTLRRMLGLKLK